MSMLPVGIGSAEAGGYQIERSLRFNSADSAYLNRTPASAGNRTTWTWSGWVKRGGITLSSNTPFFSAGTSSSEFVMFYVSSTTDRLTFYTLSGGVDYGFQTSAVLRDPSAWYHLMCVYDSTNGTAANRLKLYINGVQYTDKATDYGDIPLNHQTFVNATNEHLIGKYTGNAQYLNGYMTEVNFIDGQALTPSSFGETDTDTGVWKPKKYTGSYGTNGFYLNFSDNSGTTSTTLGKDSSGNGNNWTPNNFSVTAGAGNDSLVDTPTPYGTDTGAGGGVRGNYCTWNALELTGGATLTNGNLDFNAPNSNTDFPIKGTMGASSGKWYYEVTITATSLTNPQTRIGVCTSSTNMTRGSPGLEPTSWGQYVGGSTAWNNSSFVSSGSALVVNDILMVAYDIDGGKIWWGKNGTWFNSGDPSSGTNAVFTNLSGELLPAIGDSSNTATSTNVANFGQRPFAYTAPSGFKALCTQNLPEPTIVDGGDYFNTVLYTGNGSTQSITGVGFQPDWVWYKRRNSAYDHRVFDAVRGATKALYTNLNIQEFTDSGLTSFNSDGFSLGTAGNESGNTYVAWNWKANGAGSSNTAGTITSTVSVNTTSGFSIVTYTGNGSTGTIGHGLGVTPAMIIVKSRSTAQRWTVFHTSTSNAYIYLNETFAAETANANLRFGNNSVVVQPSSTVFTIGNSVDVNQNTTTYVAYCFAPVTGYSAFGRYTGNGNADGPMIFTGFRPKFVMVKITNTTGNWLVWDSVRDIYNVVDNDLRPNLSNAESTEDAMDFLSNGFKLRATSGGWNGSGNTYLYACFSESPFKYSLAR